MASALSHVHRFRREHVRSYGSLLLEVLAEECSWRGLHRLFWVLESELEGRRMEQEAPLAIEPVDPELDALCW